MKRLTLSKNCSNEAMKRLTLLKNFIASLHRFIASSLSTLYKVMKKCHLTVHGFPTHMGEAI
jgi:hypothetical protein